MDDGRIIFAACDKELLGQIIEDKERGICLVINREFFGDKEIQASEFVEMLTISSTAFLVGEETISLATKNGFISEGIEKVRGIPYVMYIRW